MARFTLSFLFLFAVEIVLAQAVYEPSGNTVYRYLDEMAAAGRISINTFAKPFTRRQIADFLNEVDGKRDEMTNRQSEQLDFFLRDYAKELRVGKDWDRRRDLFFYSDSVFQLTVNPILGGSVMVNENGNRIWRRVGGEFFASAGNFGFYGSLRDNNVSEVLAAPEYLTTRQGENYKSISAENRSDFNEATGGITYQWKWGDVAVMKDRLTWGNTVRNANVFSGKAPSYAMLNYRLYPTDWLEFQYIHGWLVSEELDSARTYLTPNGNRKIYMNKNIAANYLTIKSNWDIDFTFGNSIVYSDNGLNPVYFIPFMFFKSVDHTYSGTGSNELGQNAQLFFDVSVRAIKNLHLYASLFVDEVSLSNMWDSDNQTNITSLKLGGTWFNALPNIHLSGEYTRTNPWTYRHQIESTTFASNQYNMGHYLGENADEIYGCIEFIPMKNLRFKAGLWYVRKGEQHVYDIINGNANVTGLEFMETVDWSQTGASFSAEWEVINGAVVFLEMLYLDSDGNEAYTPEFISGQVISAEGGFRIGF
ncbi:MAG: hypothetical protein ACJAQ4_002136 [Cryomorphaceae bacterium]|jgi:hypothetical protein